MTKSLEDVHKILGICNICNMDIRNFPDTVCAYIQGHTHTSGELHVHMLQLLSNTSISMDSSNTNRLISQVIIICICGVIRTT